MYGEDALFIANEYNKTEATLTYLGSSKKKDAQLASQSINKGQLQTIIRDLLTNRMYKVEIWASKPNTSQWERIKKVPSYNMLDEDASIARMTLAHSLVLSINRAGRESCAGISWTHGRASRPPT